MKSISPILLAAALLTAGLMGSCSVLDDSPLVPPTADQDPLLPSIQIQLAGKTRTIHARSFGDPTRPLLLVVPGSLSDVRAYLGFQAFADAYHVVIWDLPGSGLSERLPAGELGMANMVEAMHQVKLHYSPQQAITIVGHSWSASMTAQYCGRYPADTVQAVLIEPPGLKAAYNEGLNQVLRLSSVGYCDMNWFQESLSPASHESIDYAMLAMLDSGVRDFYVDINRKPDWPVWRVGGLALVVWEKEVLNASGAWEFDHTAGLDRYPNTVLLVGSSHSPLGYEFQRTTNALSFNAVRLLKIEQAGHRILTEQWAQLEAGLRDYLSQYP